jgi:hypothetical protein
MKKKVEKLISKSSQHQHKLKFSSTPLACEGHTKTSQPALWSPFISKGKGSVYVTSVQGWYNNDRLSSQQVSPHLRKTSGVSTRTNSSLMSHSGRRPITAWRLALRDWQKEMVPFPLRTEGESNLSLMLWRTTRFSGKRTARVPKESS